jgi:hypothetical protein
MKVLPLDGPYSYLILTMIIRGWEGHAEARTCRENRDSLKRFGIGSQTRKSLGKDLIHNNSNIK